jgi:hypothetical protein
VRTVEARIASVDSSVATYGPTRLADAIANTVGDRRMLSKLLTEFAALALGLDGPWHRRCRLVRRRAADAGDRTPHRARCEAVQSRADGHRRGVVAGARGPRNWRACNRTADTTHREVSVSGRTLGSVGDRRRRCHFDRRRCYCRVRPCPPRNHDRSVDRLAGAVSSGGPRTGGRGPGTGDRGSKSRSKPAEAPTENRELRTGTETEN